MIGILYVDRHATDMRRHSGVIIDHCHSSFLRAELQKRLKTKTMNSKLLVHPEIASPSKDSSSHKSKSENISAGPRTWFLPFSVRILVTFPKGSPRAMISASDTSLGNFLMWRTRDGGASPTLSSTLSFLLSLPLDVVSAKIGQKEDIIQGIKRTLYLEHTLIFFK